MSEREELAKRPAKAIWREGAKVLKVFDGGYSVSDILNEALNQARVMETDLPIPRILEVSRVEGRWAIHMEHVEGPTLASLIAKEPGRRQELMERLVDVQVDMHRRPGGLLNSLFEKTRRKIDETGLDASTRYELQVRLQSMPRGRSLLHGDFNPGNVVMSPGGRDFILDWSHASRGDPPADAARTYLLFRLAGDEQGAEGYLDLFCQKSGRSHREVQAWLPLVAAAQSVKGDERERELLLSWVNVFDFQ